MAAGIYEIKHVETGHHYRGHIVAGDNLYIRLDRNTHCCKECNKINRQKNKVIKLSEEV